MKSRTLATNELSFSRSSAKETTSGLIRWNGVLLFLGCFFPLPFAFGVLDPWTSFIVVDASPFSCGGAEDPFRDSLLSARSVAGVTSLSEGTSFPLPAFCVTDELLVVGTLAPFSPVRCLLAGGASSFSDEDESDSDSELESEEVEESELGDSEESEEEDDDDDDEPFSLALEWVGFASESEDSESELVSESESESESEEEEEEDFADAFSLSDFLDLVSESEEEEEDSLVAFSLLESESDDSESDSELELELDVSLADDVSFAFTLFASGFDFPLAFFEDDFDALLVDEFESLVSESDSEFEEELELDSDFFSFFVSLTDFDFNFDFAPEDESESESESESEELEAEDEGLVFCSAALSEVTIAVRKSDRGANQQFR